MKGYGKVGICSRNVEVGEIVSVTTNKTVKKAECTLAGEIDGLEQCSICFFDMTAHCQKYPCTANQRRDGQEVYFKEIQQPKDFQQ